MIEQSAPSVAIVRIQPENYVHARAFDEVVDSLCEAMKQLDRSVLVRENVLVPHVPNILIGAHLLADTQLAKLPANVVLYNFEQLHRDSTWTRPGYAQALASHVYWDYSRYNIEEIRKRHPAVAAEFVPIGYADCLTRIAPGNEDIDILFYGSINQRRQNILSRLEAAGMRVHAAFGIYGEERDALIRRAKIVLNVHYYESHILEIVRISYLMANRKAVVCELASDTEMHGGLCSGLDLVPYDEIVDRCRALLDDDTARSELGRRAFDAIRRIPYVEALKATRALNA